MFSLRFFQNKVLQKNDQVCPPPGCTWQARRMQTLKPSFPARTDAIFLADKLTIYAVSVYTCLKPYVIHKLKRRASEFCHISSAMSIGFALQR